MRHSTPEAIVLCGALALGLLTFTWPAAAETSKSVRKKMGSRFEVTAVGPGAEGAVEAAYVEIDRIEALISSWIDSSETSAVNRNAGVAPVPVSAELLGLAARAAKVSQLTGGAFDVTFASFGKLWDFSGRQTTAPSVASIEAALELVGYQRMVADQKAGTLFLERIGMKIGFGAIGKGFAANRAAVVLRQAGMTGGVVNAGGDLIAFGQREDGQPWSIGIADPRSPDDVLGHLRLTDTAVVTSGDYESYVEIDGRRYSHILDPRTGYPAEGVASATVVCPDAELADALATAVSVLGPVEGLALIDRLKNVEAMLVTVEGELLFSKNFKGRLDGRVPPAPHSSH